VKDLSSNPSTAKETTQPQKLNPYKINNPMKKWANELDRNIQRVTKTLLP
jgi:hypothetical protein